MSTRTETIAEAEMPARLFPGRPCFLLWADQKASSEVVADLNPGAGHNLVSVRAGERFLAAVVDRQPAALVG